MSARVVFSLLALIFPARNFKKIKIFPTGVRKNARSKTTLPILPLPPLRARAIITRTNRHTRAIEFVQEKKEP
jgi:hypothetical protein